MLVIGDVKAPESSFKLPIQISINQLHEQMWMIFNTEGLFNAGWCDDKWYQIQGI